MVSTIRRVVGASVAVIAALTLTACDSQQIGAAAVVGDQRITVSDLQDQARAIAELPDSTLDPHGDLSEIQRTILALHIRHEVLGRVAEDEGLEVTDAEIDTALEQGGLPASDESVVAELDRTNVHDQLMFQKLVEAGDEAAAIETFNAAAAELGIEVNPRYGTWGEDLTVTPDSGSISEAVDAAPAPDEAAPDQ